MGKIIENYSLQQILGEGVYGKVYRAVNMKTNQIVAIKVIKADKFKQIPKLEQCTVNQINTLSSMEENIHIVKYIDMLKTLNNFYFVYQYCNGGTLEKQMKSYRNTNNKSMPESKAIAYFKQIIQAFKTLTKNNIMHRDLKPDNILLHNGIIKLADFGFCKILNSPEDLAQTMLGSPIYMAPEVLKGEQYTIKADIWSLGVVFYEMLFGECPFQSNSIAKLIQLLEKDDLIIPKPINPAVEKLLRRMLIKDRFKRIDWTEIFDYKLVQQSEVNIKNFGFSGSMKSGISFHSTSSNSSNGSQGSSNNSNTHSISTQQISINNNQYQNMIKKRSPIKFEQQNPGYSSTTDLCNKESIPIISLQQYTNTHKKFTELTRLSIQTLKKPQKQSIVVSYLLLKQIQKQFLDLLQSLKSSNEFSSNSLNKQQIMGTIKYQKQFKQLMQKQIESLQIHLKLHRQQLQKLSFLEPLFFTTNTTNNKQLRNKYLKQMISGMRIFEDEMINLSTNSSRNIDNIILVAQILDYFQQSIVLKIDAYQRLGKQQILKQISNRIGKLNI